MEVSHNKFTPNWVINSSEENLLDELKSNRKDFFQIFEKNLNFSDKEVNENFIASKKIISIISHSDLKNTDKKVVKILSKALQENPETFHEIYGDLESITSQKVIERLFIQNPTDDFLFNKICQFSSAKAIEEALSFSRLDLFEHHHGYFLALSNDQLTPEVIQSFQRKGVDVESYMIAFDDPFISIHPQVVKALIEAGVNLRIKSESFNNLLERLCSDSNSTEELVEQLLSAQTFTQEEMNRALQIACSVPQSKAIKILVSHNADVNSLSQEGLSPLCLAIKNTHTINDLTTLIDGGADLNFIDPHGNTLVHFACSHYGLTVKEIQAILDLLPNSTQKLTQLNNRGLSPLHLATSINYDLMQTLLDAANLNFTEMLKNDQKFKDAFIANFEFTLEDFKKYNIDVNDQDAFGRNYLHRACISFPESISKLIDVGVDLNAHDLEGNTPLHYLCQKDLGTELLKLLIENGAEIESQNNLKETPLFFACDLKQNNPSIFFALLELGANPEVKLQDNTTLLHWVCMNKYFPPEAVTTLLERGLNYLEENDYQQTPLQRALEHNLQAVIPLVEYGYDINSVDSSGQTALHLVCARQPELIQLFLDHGADPSIFDQDGNIPLHIAALNPKITPEQLQLIASYSNQTFENHKNETPIETAALHKPENLPIFWEAGFGINAQDSEGNTVLHRACFNHPSLIKVWIDQGAHIDILNDRQEPPLHAACVNPDIKPEDIAPLITPATINAQDIRKTTALHKACICNLNLFDILVENHADVLAADQKKRTVMHFAVGNPAATREDLKKLVDYGFDINASMDEDFTPLTIALHTNPKIVPEILALNPNLNIRDLDGQTPIFYALFNPKTTPEILTELIKNGAQVNVFSNNNHSPLHFACMYSPHLIEVMLKNGADVNANLNGTKPIHMATNPNMTSEHLQLLIDYGASIDDRDSSGETLLHKICTNTPSLIKTVLAFNPEIEVKNSSGYTPLFYACSASTEPSDIEELVNKGANLNIKLEGRRNLLHAISMINPIHISTLINLGGADQIDEATLKGSFPLHIACQNPNITKEQLLLVLGKHVNEPQNDGATPLQLACEFGNIDAILTLIENGADLTNQIDLKDRSLLHLICANPNIDPSDFYTLINKGIKLELIDHPEFSTRRFSECLLEHPELFDQAVSNGLNLRLFNEVLNTSPIFFNEPNAFLNFIKEPIITCFYGLDDLGFYEAQTEKELVNLIKDNREKIFTPPRNFSYYIFKVPLLLQNPELKKMFEEKIRNNPDLEPDFEYENDLIYKANYAYENLFNTLYVIDTSHFSRGAPENIHIPPAEYFDLDKLKEMFSEINFQEPDQPGYKNPSKLSIDGNPSSIRELSQGIDHLITGLKQSELGYYVPGEEKEKDQYFENYRNMMMHFGHLLPSLTPDERASLLIEIASMGTFCGVRFQEAKNLYDIYFPQTESQEQMLMPTLEKLVCQNLLNLRRGILENWSHKVPGQSTHSMNRLMLRLGEQLHLPGSIMSFEDSYSTIHLDSEQLREKFDHEYTAYALFEGTKNYLLECLRDPKLKDEVLNWFQNNPPDDYKADEYYQIFTRIEELEDKGESREKIRALIRAEFNAFIPPDQSLEEAIKHHISSQQTKPIEFKKWKAEFYESMFASLKEMRGQPFSNIQRFLEERGIQSEVFNMNTQELEEYLKEKEITLEELPEFILDKFRNNEYLDYEDNFNSQANKMFSALMDKIEGRTREEAIAILSKEGIEVRDKSYIDILERMRENDYRESVIRYKKGTYRIKDAAVNHLLQKMHILIEL